MAGSSGSFGGAGCAVAGGRAVLAAAGEPFKVGAFVSLIVAAAGIPGLTAELLIFVGDVSGLSRLLALGMTVFALALVAEGVVSVGEPATVPDLGWAFPEIFADSVGFFAVA